MIKSISWETKSGAKVVVTASLKTEKIIDSDGHKTTVKCCEKDLEIRVNGEWMGSSIVKLNSSVIVNGLTITHRVDKLGLTDNQVKMINDLNAEIDNTPEMIANKKANEKAATDSRYYESHVAKMNKVMSE